MKSLQDAIYNWLTIKVVTNERPDDSAAVETERLFYEILIAEFGLTNIEIIMDEEMYFVKYSQNGKSDNKRFPRELIDVMLNQINQEPDKYVNYPDE
ncbi:hypothetical protein [Bacillus massilinigeriensis]|uniref:hypothetical protein n=1 Tax=Bacillus massilionigeriensis TaxID=1805475 RepID=UPI00096AEA4E|nr:hypothetical protein [Bacillus massilionigeriensis]